MKSRHQRIQALLELIAGKVDAYMIACKDEFQNEFPPLHNQRLRWLTSFSGSNGIAIISRNQYIFFTDGRYLTQAKHELIKRFVIYDVADKYHIKKLSMGLSLTIGYDPKLLSVSFIQYCEQIIADNKNITLIPIARNLVDVLWKRVIHYPTKIPIILSSKYTGVSIIEKMKLITQDLDTDYLLITDPAAICWLLNIRGNDTSYTPVLMCYCLIKNDCSVELFSYLEQFESSYSKLTSRPFHECEKRFLELNRQGYSVQFDKGTPIWFWQHCRQVKLSPNPCSILKAIKNPVELSGIKFAHKQDGIAIIRLMRWLHDNGKNLATEIEVDQQLDKFKKLSSVYVQKSFATIAGFGTNSAIIHYNATNNSNLKLNQNNILLLDSGSQYQCGTTDVTRCFHFGIPSSIHKKHYTLVLKCLIKLSRLHFPVGTNGSQLDGIAREFLWKYGLDYPHGTGHGVGCYLGVHEGPMAISKNNLVPLQKNMILSIEPGVYLPNEYGIRIENMVVITQSIMKSFLCFETLTRVPIVSNLIDFSLLEKHEITWLKDYHDKIKRELVPSLSKEEKAFGQAACTL